MKEVTLEKLNVSLKQVMAVHLLEAQVDVYFDQFIEALVAEIKGYIWSEQHQHIEIEHPRDWWQAFKEKWFLRWMLRRWPVEYTRHVFDVKTMYPDYRPNISDQEYRLRFLVVGRTDLL